VYVADGNARIWGLDRASGAVRFGLAVGAVDFAVTRSRAGAPRLVVPYQGVVAAFDPTGAPPPLEPFLRWELEARNGPNGQMCHARALAWIDGSDRPVWTRELPSRVRDQSLGECSEYENAYYLRAPRQMRALVPPTLGMARVGGSLVVADISGVLALRASTGAVELDVAAPVLPVTKPDRTLFFDEGTFAVTGIPGCGGTSSQARVFAQCGSKLIYFNGTSAMVLSGSPLRVEARGAYNGAAAHTPQGRAATSSATIQVGKYVLRLEGTTYMH
jgi:hypothetical protein